MNADKPVSDLRNYNAVSDDEEHETENAMMKLMHELGEGKRSGEEEGYLSPEDVRACLHNEQL